MLEVLLAINPNNYLHKGWHHCLTRGRPLELISMCQGASCAEFILPVPVTSLQVLWSPPQSEKYAFGDRWKGGSKLPLGVNLIVSACLTSPEVSWDRLQQPWKNINGRKLIDGYIFSTLYLALRQRHHRGVDLTLSTIRGNCHWAEIDMKPTEDKAAVFAL